MEISFEAWEGVQRHGQDLADRLAQGFTGLLQVPPQFPWPPSPHKRMPFDIDLPVVPFGAGGPLGVPGKDFPFPAAAVSSVIDIGGRLGQAGAELGASVGGAVQHAVRRLPVPFRNGQIRRRKLPPPLPQPPADSVGEGAVGLFVERAAVDRCPLEAAAAAAAAATGSAAASSVSGPVSGEDLDEDDDGFGCDIGTLGNFKKANGTVNMSATYNTRSQDIESSVVARGGLWRLEASVGPSTSGNDTSPLYLIQLGPLLFVRDSTLLLPVHLSKQHLLWYGYDRKSFMDLQFPNGQLTYVAGEGISASGFLPLFGGLLQAHGKYPGETRVSFSCKNKRGTRFTPMVQWPDKSVSLGVTQALAWKRSGLMVRPSIQVSVCPTFGGSDPGVRAEVVHSLKEELNLMCGLSCSQRPSAYTALSIGRSKWNGQVGSSGVVITLETPLNNIGRPSLSVQLNGGFEL
ncbi:hypothetical protein Zm00014a_026014 [Zea mays]|uniref:Epstein-Barr nuclear antigen 2 n=1 Tax=Zea mays TaxID=4577 RepID=A0A3L6DQR7_MAIZE|nr:hypothetical protein Zm00014a_026014 [Zea mays]PWZ10928.1 hypothetical protein Zm00014a_026014 [Zea mays]PWZ10929.1 hypothetical protein Zm00014a_026014 [Zea mays]PWZ10930.1 hypothetical protein Zm00014a_026014 [Zea mays]